MRCEHIDNFDDVSGGMFHSSVAVLPSTTCMHLACSGLQIDLRINYELLARSLLSNHPAWQTMLYPE